MDVNPGPVKVLHVVTHRTWVASDLADAAPAEVLVRHSLGLDVPRFTPGDALWAPTEWAARARRVLGNDLLPLADPGPGFLTLLPPSLLGRRVGRTTVADLAGGGDDVPDLGFFKPANIKSDRLPASWTTRQEFISRAREAGVPPGTEVLWADTFLDLDEEHRVFIRDGQAVTSSVYLRHGAVDGGTLWHEAMTSDRDREARVFAARVLAELDDQQLPPAFVLDVACTTTGEWVVVETNPVWSSAQYGADPKQVISCLFAANAPGVADGPWSWSPDPYLVTRAERQRLLPRE